MKRHNVHPVRLSRRTVLGGAGVAIALPVLEAMLDDRGRPWGTAWAGAGGPPVRLMTFFVPNGLGNGGDEYSMLPNLLSAGPLTPHADDILLVTTLDKVEQYNDDTSGRADAHATGHCTFATGYGTVQGGAGGPSVEQLAAGVLGGDTRFRSLVATLQQYPEAYFNNISWTAAATPVPPYDDPAALFSDLFADGAPEPGLVDHRPSILDHVENDLKRLQSRVGAADRTRIDQHLTAIRDLENQIGNVASCDEPVEPVDTEALSNERARAFLDLIVLAFQCDLTRFASFMLGNRGNQRQFPWIDVVGGADSGGGYEEGHHGMSHDSSDTGRDRLVKIVTDEVEQLAYLLDRLRATPDTTGTLLDNAIVFFGTEHATSETHNVYGMQAIVAGRGGGAVPVGQVFDSGGQQWGRTLASVLDWLGLDPTQLGPHAPSPLSGV